MRDYEQEQRLLDAQRRQMEIDSQIQALESQNVRVGLDSVGRERLAELIKQQREVWDQVNGITAQPFETESEKEARVAAEEAAKAAAEEAEEATAEELAEQAKAQAEFDTAARQRLDEAETPEQINAIMAELGLTQ